MRKWLAVAVAVLGLMSAVATADPPSSSNADPTNLDPVAVDGSVTELAQIKLKMTEDLAHQLVVNYRPAPGALAGFANKG